MPAICFAISDQLPVLKLNLKEWKSVWHQSELWLYLLGSSEYQCAQCSTLASDNSAMLQLLRFLAFTSTEPLDSAIQLPNWILLIFNWWWWGWLSVYFHLRFCSASLHLNISCSIQVFWKQRISVEMLSVYLSSFLFQRGSDELFSTCVTNGPFIMSSNASSAGNTAYKKRIAIDGYCRYYQEVWFWFLIYIFTFKKYIFLILTRSL